MHTNRFVVPLVAVALLLSGCAATTPPAKEVRAVVLMSGGAAVSPFTTPDKACTTGLAAGNTDTALREFLLKQGKLVYTAPASDTWGVVTEPDPSSFGAFGNCPLVLPEQLTVMSSGDIDSSAQRLARFVMYLHDSYGLTDVDFVGHSNGGLFVRGAIRILEQTKAPVTIHSLTMIGTPNVGAFPTAYATGSIGLDACAGNAFCIGFNSAWLKYAGRMDKGLNAEDTKRFLLGKGDWNEAQAGYLDNIPVTMLGGSNWTNAAGDPSLWPYDGIVPVASAHAVGVSDAVIPHRACWSAPLTHSIFVSDYAKLDWNTALTWNTAALARVNAAIDSADSALSQPNREGCPAS